MAHITPDNSAFVRNVLLFPTMKSIGNKGSDRKGKEESEEESEEFKPLDEAEFLKVLNGDTEKNSEGK